MATSMARMRGINFASVITEDLDENRRPFWTVKGQRLQFHQGTLFCYHAIICQLGRSIDTIYVTNWQWDGHMNMMSKDHKGHIDYKDQYNNPVMVLEADDQLYKAFWEMMYGPPVVLPTQDPIVAADDALFNS